MRKYKCIRTCSGFQKRYWMEGQIAEVADGQEEPPHHFVLIDDDTPLVPFVKVEEPATMSAIALTINPVIRTGMAAGLDHRLNEPMPIASTAKMEAPKAETHKVKAGRPKKK